MTLGETLRKARTSKCLTQRELAAYIKVSPQMICYYEKDRKIPGLRVLRKYGEVLGLDVEFLADLKYGREENHD